MTPEHIHRILCAVTRKTFPVTGTYHEGELVHDMTCLRAYECKPFLWAADESGTWYQPWDSAEYDNRTSTPGDWLRARQHNGAAIALLYDGNRLRYVRTADDIEYHGRHLPGGWACRQEEE